ncbi:hypothetical protein OH77DRAFT_1589467 [Trametes cingulata]|nr:hypothetical protein OH77DRAFT_1589467 [Trametes cingulata]
MPPPTTIYAKKRGAAPSVDDSGGEATVLYLDIPIAPSIPLHVGQRVRILALIPCDDLFPTEEETAARYYTTKDIGVWGTVVRMRVEDREVVEFALKNDNIQSEVTHAYLAIPRREGLTYGLNAEKPEQLGGDEDREAARTAEDDEEMDYSDSYETPMPAQNGARVEEEGTFSDEAEETAASRDREDENEGPPSNAGGSRGRKRPRVRSPETEQEDEGWSPTRDWSVRTPNEDGGRKCTEAQDGADSQLLQHQQQAPQVMQEPRNTAPSTADAPPPYPILPPVEECEHLIEQVVQDAADNLRTKLRTLVGQARGQVTHAEATQPPMSQDTYDYWQHYADPTAALLDFEMATGAGLDAWPTLEEAPKQEYDDMEVLLARCAPKITPAQPAQPQPRHENAAPNWSQPVTAMSDPRARATKGKERQREDAPASMEIDKPATHRGVANAPTAERSWATWNGEAEEVEAHQEMSQEEAEERRWENLRKKWEEAKLAKPIAEREASGQPEHRRRVDHRERETALALQATRASEIAKLSLAPPLEDGHPAVHVNAPRDRVRNVPDSKLKEWRAEQAGTCVLLDVYGEGDIEDTDPQRIYDNLQAALKRITGLGKVNLEQPPKTPRTASKEHAATTWFASGLYPAATALLVMVHAWPTADITFFAYREVEFIPRYFFAIKGFTQDDHDEVRLAVWDIFRKSPIYPSIYNLVKKNPDYVGKDHHRVTHEILSTIEVSIKPVNEEKHARLITHVYMTSPTRSAAMWESWRDGLRYPPKGRPFSEEHPHLEVSQRITRCKACHGADHLTTQCQYGHLEGWAKVAEGPSSRRPNQWRARTPRPGQSQYANEQDGAHFEAEDGAAGWSYADPRSRGSRGQGARGGGMTRGAQPKPRRN